MKLQQICRFRLGIQEAEAGYQTCGVSNGITLEIEDEFADKVKTVKVYPRDKERSVWDWSCSPAGRNYYLVCISYGEDALPAHRPTPLCHGIVVGAEDAETFMSNPEKFMSFSNTNFIYEWDAKDLTKKQLPELNGLALDSGYHFSMDGIQKKYQLSDEQFKSLLYHIYEILLSDGKIEAFSFIWDGPKASYMDVMRDMMYVVYSSVPMMLKSRISFASDRLEGMVNRMFTVANSAETGSWFDLNTGESSTLQEINEDNFYRVAFVEYLAAHAGTPDAAELLEWMDEFAQRIYRRPDVKSGTALMNAMSAAFLTWKKEIAQQYFKPGQLVRVAHSMVILRADDREFLDDKAGEILQQAVMSGGKINNIQLENMQKLYVATNSQIYRNAYQMAVALKDQESVYKSLVSALKEQSNEVTDNFIAFLLEKLPKTAEIQTQEVMDGLNKRYYVTDNTYLQDYYLEYVEAKYQQELSDGAIDAMILPAFQNLAQQEQGTKAYERASRYLQYQIDTLFTKKRKASDAVLEKMASEFGKLPKGELRSLIRNYALNCYLGRSEDEAVEYYEKLRTIGGPLFEEIKDIFYFNENRVLDLHFVRKLYPKMSDNTFGTQIKAMETVVKFPIWDESGDAILGKMRKLCVQMMQKEAGAVSKAGKDGRESKENKESKELEIPLSEHLHDIYVSIDEALIELNQIGGSKLSSQINDIREACKNVYWDSMEVGMKTRNCLKYREMYCDHPNCRKIYDYYKVLEELEDSVSIGRFDLSERCLELLTTNTFSNNAKMRNHLIKKHLTDRIQEYQKPTMEADCLLVMNYDNEKDKFTNTAFLKDMTKEQWQQLEMGSIMLQLHPGLNAEMEAYQKKASRANKFKNFFKNPKARIGLLAAGLVILLGGGTAIALSVMGGDKGDVNDTKAIAQTDDSAMNSVKETESLAVGTSEGTSEGETEESSTEESSTEESSAESTGADTENTFPGSEYEAAFMVTLGENQFGLEDNHIRNMTAGKNLATNGYYSHLKTDGTYLYCVKDNNELRRYDNPGSNLLNTETLKKITVAGGTNTVTAYEVMDDGTVCLLASDNKVYTINMEDGSQPVEVLDNVTAIAYDNGNLYAAQEKKVSCYASDKIVVRNEINTCDLPENPNEMFVENGTIGYLVSGAFYIYDQQNSTAEEYVALDVNQPYNMVDGYLYGAMKKAGSEDEYKEGRFTLADQTISWIAE